MNTIVLGLGNPILSDDGAGCRVAEELESRLDKKNVTVRSASLAGLDLLEQLSGYDKAIIVDTIQTAGGRAGQIYRLEPETFSGTRHTTTPHDINFATALELGKKLNIPLPREIVIFAIEAAETSRFSQTCTPPVAEAIPACVQMVLQELEKTAPLTEQSR